MSEKDLHKSESVNSFYLPEKGSSALFEGPLDILKDNIDNTIPTGPAVPFRVEKENEYRLLASFYDKRSKYWVNFNSSYTTRVLLAFIERQNRTMDAIVDEIIDYMRGFLRPETWEIYYVVPETNKYDKFYLTYSYRQHPDREPGKPVKFSEYYTIKTEQDVIAREITLDQVRWLAKRHLGQFLKQYRKKQDQWMRDQFLEVIGDIKGQIERIAGCH